MSYLCAVINGNSSVILKTAALIDKHVRSHSNIFAEIRCKWRKQAECFIHVLSDQLGKKLPYFFWGVIAVIQAAGNLHTFTAHNPHEFMNVGIYCDLLTAADKFEKFFICHSNYLIINLKRS